MSWTYLKFDNDGEPLPGNRRPPSGTAYLAFDALRWKVVIGYTERGGYSSILNPNVTDDCCIVAYAPLNESTDPNEAVIRNSGPWTRASYRATDGVKLLREIEARK